MSRPKGLKRKRKKASIDRTDEAIIRCLEHNPEILQKNIADSLKDTGLLPKSLSYPSVQRRIKKLRDAKIIGQPFSINWAAAGYDLRFRVGILIDPVKLASAQEYNSQEGLADFIMNGRVRDLIAGEVFENEILVEDAYILLGGDVDLAVDFYAKTSKKATLFIINGLRNLAGVTNTTTAHLNYSSRHGWFSANEEES